MGYGILVSRLRDLREAERRLAVLPRPAVPAINAGHCSAASPPGRGSISRRSGRAAGGAV